MTKIAMWLIRILFWIQAFAGPVLVFGFLAFIVYNNGEQNKNIAITLLGIGAIAGIILAEWIRGNMDWKLFWQNIWPK